MHASAESRILMLCSFYFIFKLILLLRDDRDGGVGLTVIQSVVLQY